MATGVGAWFALDKQNSFGSIASGWNYVRITNEDITNDINFIEEQGLRGRFTEGPIHRGVDAINGSVAFEVEPITLGHFLQGVTGSVGSSSGIASVNSSYLHTFAPENNNFDDGFSPLPPYTLQINRDVETSFQFSDVFISGMDITITQNAIVNATARVVGRSTSLMAKTTPTFTTVDPFIFDAASVSLAGVGNADFQEIAFTIENQLEPMVTLDGTRKASRFVRTGPVQARVNGTIDFRNNSEYANFLSGSEQAMVVRLESSPASINILTFTVPRFTYEAFPVAVPGPGRLTATFNGRAVYDTTSSLPMHISLINSGTVDYT